jgi:hypothetical protein
MNDRTGLIRITNNNEKSIVGRYAGVDYHFKPGSPVDVPEIVATHLFAFGQDDKAIALARLGWAVSSDQIDAGLEKLARVEFTDPPEMIEAPSKPKAAKKTGPAGPPVDASGSEGGSLMKRPPNGPRIGEEGAEGATEF